MFGFGGGSAAGLGKFLGINRLTWQGVGGDRIRVKVDWGVSDVVSQVDVRVLVGIGKTQSLSHLDESFPGEIGLGVVEEETVSTSKV